MDKKTKARGIEDIKRYVGRYIKRTKDLDGVVKTTDFYKHYKLKSDAAFKNVTFYKKI